ncbi:MAG: hypothetical protein C4345_13915 [Chloroflexota bacterium]
MSIRIHPKQIQYVVWQNRSFNFYLAARVLYHTRVYRAAAFNANLALELLLKATLLYHDPSFDPTRANHRFAGMLRTLRNKVPGGASAFIPGYFHHGQRYQLLARYPSNGPGLLIPASFLADLDGAFCALVKLVPFQHNTELKRLLGSRDRMARLRLTRGNASASALRRLLRVRVASPIGNDLP